MSEDTKKTLPIPAFQSKLDKAVNNQNSHLRFSNEVSQAFSDADWVNEHAEFVLDETFGRCLAGTKTTEALGGFGVDDSLLGNSDEMTLACWVKCDPSKASVALVSHVDSTRSWALMMKDRLEFCWINDSVRNDYDHPEWSRLIASKEAMNGQWAHVAITNGAQCATMYVNGKTVASSDGVNQVELPVVSDVTLGPNVEIKKEQLALRGTYAMDREFAIKTIAFFQDDDTFWLGVRGEAFQPDENGDWGGQMVVFDVKAGHFLKRQDIRSQTANQGLFMSNGIYMEAGSAGLLNANQQSVQNGHHPIDPSTVNDDFNALQNHDLKTPTPCCALATDGKDQWVIGVAENVDAQGKRVKRHEGVYLLVTEYEYSGTSTWYKLGMDVPTDAPSFISYDHTGKRFWIVDEKNRLTPFVCRRGQLFSDSDENGKALAFEFDSAVKAIVCPTAPGTLVIGGGQLCCMVLLESGKIHLFGKPTEADVDVSFVEMVCGLTNLPDDFPHIQSFDMDAASRLVVLGTAHHFFVYDLQTDRLLTDGQAKNLDTVHDHDDLTSAIISPDGSTIAVMWAQASVQVWDVDQLLDADVPFTGRLTGLRYYDSELSQSDVEQIALSDLPTTQVGTIFPLEFSLHNEKQQQALFLTENEQHLYLEITNMGDVPIVVPNQAELDGSNLLLEDRHSMALKFRPGTFLPDDEEGGLAKTIHLAPVTDSDPDLSNPDGTAKAIDDDSPNWTLQRSTDKDNNDIWRLVHTGDDIPSRTLLAKESRTVRIGGVLVNGKRGTHASRVQLSYHLRALDGTPMMGSRLHYMRLLNMDDAAMVGHIDNLRGKAKKLTDDLAQTTTDIVTLEAKVAKAFKVERALDDAQADLDNKLYFEHGGPLEAIIIGSDVVINDGLTQNTLVVRVRAARGFPAAISSITDAAKITLILSNAHEPNWGVLDPDNLGQVIAANVLDTPEIWSDPVQSFPKVEIGQGEKHTEKGEVHIGITYKPDLGGTDFNYVDVKLDFICGTKDGAGTGQRHIGVIYEGIGRMEKTLSAAPGWLSVPVQHARFKPTNSGNTVAAALNVVNHAQLGFFKTAGLGEVDPVDAVSGIWEGRDKESGLNISSAKTIKMIPGVRPDAAKTKAKPLGLTLSTKKAKTSDKPDAPDIVTAHLDGAFSASGGVDAMDAGLSGKSLTVHGDAVITGNVQPAKDSGAPLVGSYLMPRGGIIMWHGDVTDVPAGWHLCDGTNGTPNMQQRFVVGLQGNANVDPTLMKYNAKQTGSNDPEILRLEIDHMPAHDHHWNVVEDGHSHPIWEFNNCNHDSDGNSWDVTTPGRNKDRENLKTESSKTEIDWDKAHQSQGTSKPIDRRPPFIAMCYIMKL